MKTKKGLDIKEVVQKLIALANKFDVDAVQTLFARNAVIDDVSVGTKYKNETGVRRYFDTYFVGYKTVTKLDSINIVDPDYAEVKVDFRGNFGHEKGRLNITINKEGLISKIDADLD